MTSYARHDLVWLTAQGWEQALHQATANVREMARAWQQRDWPAIVRRRDADANETDICIGIAPPPLAGRKQRFGLRVARDAIRERVAPPRIDSLLPSLPVHWQVPLAALHEEAADHGLEFRAYGSAALQYLTGQAHVTDTSDIDLLLRPRTRAQLDGGVALLSAHARRLPLDGEIVFGDGQGVSWKEWAAAIRTGNGARVLVKNLHTVRLLKTGELLDSLEEKA